LNKKECESFVANEVSKTINRYDSWILASYIDQTASHCRKPRYLTIDGNNIINGLSLKI